SGISTRDILPGVNCLPGLFESAGLETLLNIDEFRLLPFCQLLEGFDRLIGTDERLPALFDLAGQLGAAGFDFFQLARKLDGVIAAGGAGVDIDVAAATAQFPQFVDL